MGWFWAESKTEKLNVPLDIQASSGCPVDLSSYKSACPVKGSSGSNEELNPLNNMPMNISSHRAPGQKLALSTTRTFSNIPRGESEEHGVWEYPSPQQMFNAMLRKGKGEGIPEDAVESMVDVHNFLNEGAWQQILEWESKYTMETKMEPRLKQFTGKPHDLSPRAQMFLWLGKYFPERFNTQPPFDRHDWTVLRSQGNAQGWKEVRYVIDYYSAPDDEETGMPSFMLDTRPALDNFENANDRFIHWAKPLWKKAMGESDTD
ncbi:Cytochrome c heme lyase [Spathaspora sp. JA1]|nr:Cytochrome c heme lyase [Spathaspora sp. JA1]